MSRNFQSVLPEQSFSFYFVIISALTIYGYHAWTTGLVLWAYSGIKYHFLLFMSQYIYLGRFSIDETLTFDGASKDVLKLRLKGVDYLSKILNEAKDTVMECNLTDCRFKKMKVLFPVLRELELPTPNFINSIESSEVVLGDGSKRLHLGCDAVHYFNNEFYKELHRTLFKRLETNSTQFSFTSLTPELMEHSKRIALMTNTDEVRYALSGSEAVDIAIKDVKMSTGKNTIVRFKNAYHGHLSGISNDAPNQIFLKEMDDKAFEFIEKFHYKIAAVIVNPMQFLSGPNQLSPPGEKLTAGKRAGKRVSRDEYANWLHKLNAKCQYCSSFLTPIAFIMDDIYFGFRTSSLFSFKYFTDVDGKELSPDLVILGKGVAGGFPLSIVCGRSQFMNCYDRNFILKVNKSVGTFTAWEGGIVASNIFLDKVERSLSTFDHINSKFGKFTEETNNLFVGSNLPLRLASFANVFTIDYLVDSLYNSMYPQFLMAEGVYFSNQSTGKFNLSDEYDEQALEKLSNILVEAGIKMKKFGFFEQKKTKVWFLPIISSFAYNFVKNYCIQIMLDKRIDIDVSHNHPFNKFGHFWSSFGMICFAYPFMLMGYFVDGAVVFVLMHALRQAGHFLYERQDRDTEKLKFGHKDGTKKKACIGVALCIAIYLYKTQISILDRVSEDDFALCSILLTVIPHFAEICHEFGWLRGSQWVVKILTDPFTDLVHFYDYKLVQPKELIDVNFLTHDPNGLKAPLLLT